MKNLFLRFACLGVALMVTNVASAVTITFGGPAGGFPGTPYTESGFTFTYSNPGPGGSAAITSGYLELSEPATIILTGTGAFDFTGFDYSHIGDSSGLTVIGNHPLGIPAADSLTIPEAGAPLIPAFATIPTGWTNLSSVVFSVNAGIGDTIALDNVVVSLVPPPPPAVPEPATAGILGLGTLIGGFCRYKRRRQNNKAAVPQDELAG